MRRARAGPLGGLSPGSRARSRALRCERARAPPSPPRRSSAAWGGGQRLPCVGRGSGSRRAERRATDKGGSPPNTQPVLIQVGAAPPPLTRVRAVGPAPASPSPGPDSEWRRSGESSPSAGTGGAGRRAAKPPPPHTHTHTPLKRSAAAGRRPRAPHLRRNSGSSERDGGRALLDRGNPRRDRP